MDELAEETGLPIEQVKSIYDKFLFDRLLEPGGSYAPSSRAFYVDCINIDHDRLVLDFAIPAASEVRYLEAALDRGKRSGKYFVEFNEFVWMHRLWAHLVRQGGMHVRVYPVSEELAHSALLRVRMRAAHCGFGYTIGTCPEPLNTMARVFNDSEKERNSLQAECARFKRERDEAMLKAFENSTQVNTLNDELYDAEKRGIGLEAALAMQRAEAERAQAELGETRREVAMLRRLLDADGMVQGLREHTLALDQAGRHIQKMTRS